MGSDTHFGRYFSLRLKLFGSQKWSVVTRRPLFNNVRPACCAGCCATSSATIARTSPRSGLLRAIVAVDVAQQRHDHKNYSPNSVSREIIRQNNTQKEATESLRAEYF